MSNEWVFALTIGFGVTALFYACVGHAGATGYLAIMALASMSPESMKSTALTLNIFVASVALLKFAQREYIELRLLIPMATFSIPFAYLGGSMILPSDFYKPIIGVFLLLSAFGIASPSRQTETQVVTPPTSLLYLTMAGAVLGFLSGLTGVGGGVYLSPLMVLCRWAALKSISGTAAGFILANSVAGLAGYYLSSPRSDFNVMPSWCMAVLIGGYIGAEYGSSRLPHPIIRKILAVTLIIAALKLIHSAL